MTLMIILVLLVPIPSHIFHGQMMILTRMTLYTGVNLNVLVIFVIKQLPALGQSCKNDVLSFDSKLLCLSADIIAPIVTKFAN